MKKTPFERRLDSAEIERAFLESFGDDAPPPGAKLAAMAAIGAGVSAAAVGGVASAAAGGAAGAATGGHAAGAVKAVVVLKWFSVGVLGGAAVLAPRALVNQHQAVLQRTSAVPEVTSRSERSTSVPPAAVEIDRGGEIEPTALPAPSPPKAWPQDEREDGVRGRGPATAPVVETWANSGPAGDSRPPSRLAAETALLDGARRALAEGNPASAIERLDRYQLEFPRGALQPEATVLKVEALVRIGDRRGAATLAQRTTLSLPEKYAEKIRLLLSPLE